jgi:hypothetical protein
MSSSGGKDDWEVNEMRMIGDRKEWNYSDPIVLEWAMDEEDALQGPMASVDVFCEFVDMKTDRWETMMAEILPQILMRTVIHSFMSGANSQTCIDNDISGHYIRIDDCAVRTSRDRRFW